MDLTVNGLQREEATCYEINPPCKNMNSDNLIKKVSVFDSYDIQYNSFRVEMAKNPVLKRMVIGTERIWFSSQATEISPTMGNFSNFVERAKTLGTAPLVIHTSQDMLGTAPKNIVSLDNSPAAENININLIKYTAVDLNFEVEAPSDGWLLVTDRWARSWTAKINNQTTPVYGGNFIFRAVKVSKGLNIVSFNYSPISFPYLLILSWGTMVIIFIISFWFGFKRRKEVQSKVE